jgi:hypothetical protein
LLGLAASQLLLLLLLLLLTAEAGAMPAPADDSCSAIQVRNLPAMGVYQQNQCA